MRIDELKRIAKVYSYKYSESEHDHIFTKPYSNNSIKIDKTQKEKILILIPILCEKRDFEMIKASIEFAETDPEDKEEEKKFYLRHRWIFNKDFSLYLQRKSDETYGMNISFFDFSGNDNKKFTLKEIEEIKKKFNTDLKDFELVEVEDE